MKNSVLFLGMIKKAGALEIGGESVEALARAKKARAILSASDAGENSLRRAERYCRDYSGVYLPLPFTKDELGAGVGRGLPGMLAISDTGFAAAFAEKLSSEFPGRYEAQAEELRQKAQRMQKRRQETHRKNADTGKKRRMKK